jgi:hypothetical protein
VTGEHYSRLTTACITIDKRLRPREQIRLQDLPPVSILSLNLLVKEVHISDRVATQAVSLGWKWFNPCRLHEVLKIPFLTEKVPPIFPCDCIAPDETVINLNKIRDLMLVKLFK